MESLLHIIISSPSGAGKTTLTQRLLRDYSDLTFSVSHTTRQPRSGETTGEDYYFVTPEEFSSMLHDGMFIEHAVVHGNSYGTSTSEVSKAAVEGRRGIIFDVDYQGAIAIKRAYPDAISIFLLPPSLEELERRLRGRGSEDQATIERRLAHAKWEIARYGIFDYLIVNENIQHAYSDLTSILQAERCRRSRLAHKAEDLL